MKKPVYAQTRGTARFDVNIKAMYIIRGRGMKQQECRITNLSSSGATIHSLRTENFTKGTSIIIAIAITNTLMHMPAEAEIMWIKQCNNACISGIKFTAMPCDIMIRKLVKKAPEISCVSVKSRKVKCIAGKLSERENAIITLNKNASV